MGRFQERDIFTNLEEITPNNEEEPISPIGFLHETESGTILEIASEESLEKYLRKKGKKISKGDRKTVEDLQIIMHRLRQDPLRNGTHKLGNKGPTIYGIRYDLYSFDPRKLIEPFEHTESNRLRFVFTLIPLSEERNMIGIKGIYTHDEFDKRF